MSQRPAATAPWCGGEVGILHSAAPAATPVFAFIQSGKDTADIVRGLPARGSMFGRAYATSIETKLEGACAWNLLP